MSSTEHDWVGYVRDRLRLILASHNLNTIHHDASMALAVLEQSTSADSGANPDPAQRDLGADETQ